MIGSLVVGHALVLHSGEKISHEAQSLALAVAPDADNDIVVLDLQGDVPVQIWESVARAIDRGRRGIRLVICGARTNAALFAGQWLADRLKRTVVAPHGQLIRGTAGSLFVHADEGGGWFRYRPRKAPAWQAKRYPQPPWDEAAAEFCSTSAVGAAEPLPGGVWLRDSRDPLATRRHWSWLSSSLPCQPAALTVVVGCPGTPPLPLDDIARFWRQLPDDDRRRARFVHYGPVQMPAGGVLGQVLADLVQAPVACFTGIPVGRPDRPQMHTAALHGGLGWQVFARELGYLPTPAGGPAPEPQILSYRVPRVFGDEVAPMVYRYAADAVVEIVQSGLWVRGRVAPADADRIRARVPDPTVHSLVYDDTVPAAAARMRALAEDLVERLDPATRTLSALLPASHLIAAAVAREKLSADEIGFSQTSAFSAADLGLVPGPAETAAGPVVARPRPDVPVLRRSVPGRAAGKLEPEPASVPVGPEAGVAAEPAGPAAGPPLAPGRFLAEPEAVPVEPTELTLAPADRLSALPIAPLSPVPLSQPPVPVSAAASGEPLPVLPRRVPGDTWLSTAGRRLLERDEPVRPARPGPALVNAWSSYRRRQDLVPDDAGPETAGTGMPEPVPAGPGRHRRADPTRRQPEPDPDARAVPGDGGIDGERAWLRRTFARDFDAAASTVARTLAQHPRLNAGDPAEAVTDATAVRLYLSGAGDGLDKELRSGTLGGHVPFARCAAAGLRRLPAHRGACLLRAAVDPADLTGFTAGDAVTDWSFVHALTGLAPELPGVDVLIWAMSARRTRVLEPDGGHRVEGRVVFLPGTSFKVLDVEPGRLLLRELSPDESTAARSPFDDLALAALRQCAERWTVGNPYVEVGPAAAERFGMLPGTV